MNRFAVGLRTARGAHLLPFRSNSSTKYRPTKPVARNKNHASKVVGESARTSRASEIEHIEQTLARLPQQPGAPIPMWTPLVVGKAKNLKKRVSSYFNKHHDNGKTRLLVSRSTTSSGSSRRRKPMLCC